MNLLPPPPPATNAPDIVLACSPVTNAVTYRVYCGKHYPNWQYRWDYPGTTLAITNLPRFQNDFWMTALGADGSETVPGKSITITNGFEFCAITITCNGTGNVYQCSDLTTHKWSLIRTNFHGTVLSATNPTDYQPVFFEGLEMKSSKRVWNQ